jgi:hypothetical protein
MKRGKPYKGGGKKDWSESGMQGGDGKRNQKHKKAPEKTGHTDDGRKGNTPGPHKHLRTSSTPLTSAQSSHVPQPAVARRSFSTYSAKAMETFAISYHQAREINFKKRQALNIRGKWANAIQILDMTCDGPRNQVKFLEDKVQHYDNQFRRAVSRTALYRLLEVKAALMAALSTLPFKLDLVFWKDLGYILCESPYERILKMSRPTKKLVKAFHYDLAVIYNARKALRTPYKANTYYQAIRYKGEYVTPIANPIDALWQDRNQMIDFPLSFVSAHHIIPFKKYIFHLREFHRTILDAHKDLFVLRFRRNPVSARQGIFNAIHHDFN